MTDRENFLSSLRATFYEEALDNAQKLSTAVEQLDKMTTQDQRRRLCQQLLQRMQTLVAAAQAAEVLTVVRLGQAMEGLFESLGQHLGSATSDVLFTLNTVVENLVLLLQGLAGVASPLADSEVQESIDLVASLRQQIVAGDLGLVALDAAGPPAPLEQPLVRPELMKRLQEMRTDATAILHGEGLTEFELELFDTFRIEAAEHLQALHDILAQIGEEREADRLPSLYHIANRAAHTLKGAARAVEVAEVEAIAECIEHVFAPFKSRSVRLSRGFVEAMGKSFEALARLLSGQRQTVRDRVELTLYVIKQLSRLNLATPEEQPGLDMQLPSEQPAVREQPRSAIISGISEELHHLIAEPEAVTQELPPEFLQELLATFGAEAQEQIETISAGLIALEKAPGAAERDVLLEAIFRGMHTLKGGARAVGLTDLEGVCQVLETICSKIKKRQIIVNTSTYDVLLSAMGLLSDMLGGQTVDARPMLEKLAMIEAGFVAVAAHPPNPPGPGTAMPVAPVIAVVETPPVPADKRDGVEEHSAQVRGDRSLGNTIRISTAKLDHLFSQVEEMLAAKLTLTQRHQDLREMTLAEDNWRREWTKVGPDLQTLQRLLKRRERGAAQQLYDLGDKLIEFVNWNHNMVRTHFSRLRSLRTVADADTRTIGGMVDNLQEDMKHLLMLPFSMILAAFPRSVREMARSLGKDVELVLDGTEVEIDRRILEQLKDPLLHLVRNAVYHGIEDGDLRVRQAKPRQGRITLSITPVYGGKVEIVLSDNGGGIDVERVRRAALASGLMSAAELDRMSENDVMTLIYQSDLSTSDKVTDIAGRGLGLAIVRDRIKQLGGTILVESQRNVGTRFIIRLPLTLATARGVLVKTAGQLYIVPTLNVERVLRVRPADIRAVEGRETVYLQGNPVPISRLEDLLEAAQPVRERDYVTVLVLEAGDKRLAVIVDEVVGEQEVLVKGLGRQLLRVRNVSGATILGSGQIVPILHVADLIASANHQIRRSERRTPIALAPPTSKKRIMVVDDSITSRSLIRNILESVGYIVKTAVDGVEALGALRGEPVDLVVSDVEMPRMNGLTLTERIRGDKTLSAIPVVLVTTLDSHQDRDKGTEAGANAYIVKGGFNQNNLLSTIRRLI